MEALHHSKADVLIATQPGKLSRKHIMNKFLLVIFLILSSTSTYSQNRHLDSLKLLLSIEKTYTGRVNLLNRLGGSFGFGQARNDSALWYSQQALKLSQEIKYTKGELTAVLHIASYYNQTGNYPEALKLSFRNLAMAKKFNDRYILLFQTRLVSWIYRGMGDFEKGLEFAKQLAPLADSFNENDRGSATQVANNIIAGAYLDMGLPDSALIYKRPVYQFGIAHNDREWITLGANGLGEIYAKIGDVDSAFYYYKISMGIGAEIRRYDMVSYSATNMAKLFFRMGEIDSAFLYGRKSQHALQLTNSPAGAVTTDSLLATLFQSRGQYDSAYKYLKSYVLLNDSLNNQNKIAQALNFSFNETLQKQQAEQARKEIRQQYQNRIKLYSFGGILLIFLIIAFSLFLNNRNKQKANILLGKQKEQIQNTLSELKSTQSQLIQSEKMASLGELTAGIAHEIQNPLNFVNNFSEINKELIEELKTKNEELKIEDDDVKDLLNDIESNEEKINHYGKRADGIVKSMLEHSRTSTGVKEPTDINKLADEYLRLAYHGMRAKDKNFNCELKTEFDETLQKINVVPQDIGRVLLNLFNNAFYACAEQSRSTCAERSHAETLEGLKNLQGLPYVPTVTLVTRRENDHVTITVRDNGNGIPDKIKDKIFQPFFTTKPTGQGTGLGLSLAYDIITKEHNGTINVESRVDVANPGLSGKGNPDNFREEEGTEFIVSLPV